jgi:hypothetical protein
MSSYFYLCNQIASYAIATIGVVVLLLLALWLLDRAMAQCLKSLEAMDAFRRFLMSPYWYDRGRKSKP